MLAVGNFSHDKAVEAAYGFSGTNDVAAGNINSAANLEGSDGQSIIQ